MSNGGRGLWGGCFGSRRTKGGDDRCEESLVFKCPIIKITQDPRKSAPLRDTKCLMRGKGRQSWVVVKYPFSSKGISPPPPSPHLLENTGIHLHHGIGVGDVHQIILEVVGDETQYFLS